MDFAHIASQALLLALLVAAPVVLAAAGIGLIVSLFQAATQIQEPTLTAVPKILAVAAALALGGAWMLRELMTFGGRVLENIAHVG